VGRTISLFVVHGPAGNNPARTYAMELADVEEIVAANAATEVRLVLGDFNINLFEANLAQRDAYTPLINVGFGAGVCAPGVPPPPTPSPPNPFTGYRGYFATQMKTLNNGTYWYIGNNSDFYPGYGYIDSATFSLDNVLARYGGGAGGPLSNVTILNGVVGTPFNVANPPPNGAPPGYYQFGLQMGTAADYGAPPAHIPNPHGVADPRMASFRQWADYGHIRGTSDHMPIIFDI
jgi:hypothetical protein